MPIQETLPSSASLESLELFKNVDLPAIAHHLERCQVHLLRTGDVLPDPTTVKRSAFLVLDGTFQVHRGTPAAEATGALRRGSFTEEMLMLDALLPAMCIVARGPARVLELTHETLWSLARSSHGFAMNLLGLLLRRTTRATSSDDGAAPRRHEHRALTDHLTDLYNRHGVEEQFPREILRARLQARPVALLMLDVDALHAYNEAHGHAAGDELLAALARELRTHLRPTDLVARYGGDEFGVLLPDTEAAQALRAAERVREHLQDGLQATHGVVTVSVGVAAMDAQDTLTTLLSRVLAALTRAKRAGGNATCLYDDTAPPISALSQD